MIDVVEKIRKGELDCNNNQLFFSILIKGLMLRLKHDIKIRGQEVPHVIFNTGDDIMWLMLKDYDYSKEPYENTNEQYVYNTTPRCVVSPGSIDMVPDQLTNPYSRGQFQYEYENELYTLSAEFRRMPIKINIELTYFLDSFRDALEMIQHIITKLAFIRTYKFVYMGQTIIASYKIPENFEQEHMIDMDGTSQDSKDRKITLSLEVETNIPIFSEGTVANANKVIAQFPNETFSINNKQIAEINKSNKSGYVGFGKR